MGEEKRPAWPGRMYARLEKKGYRPGLAGSMYANFFFKKDKNFSRVY
jgi:hypothetical protein